MHSHLNFNTLIFSIAALLFLSRIFKLVFYCLLSNTNETFLLSNDIISLFKLLFYTVNLLFLSKNVLSISLILLF
jgi:hypothetical protein